VGVTGAPDPAATGLRSGEVAAAAGVNRQTLRYYESRGLIETPHRTLGGHRAYPPSAVSTIKIVKAAQRLGFTLDEIAELIATGRRHAASDRDIHARAAAKMAEVEERIADLVVIRDTLRAALDAGCHDLQTCARSPGCPIPFSQLSRHT
jgi:DNA-binding transcriptional MerR regulator